MTQPKKQNNRKNGEGGGSVWLDYETGFNVSKGNVLTFNIINVKSEQI